MFDENVIRRMLRDVLLDVPGVTASLVRFQNRPFDTPTPERGVFWVDEVLSVLDETLAATEQVTAVGIVQYRVHVAIGSSMELLSTTTKAIVDAFRPGQTLRNIDGVPTGCPVVVWKAQRLASFSDGVSEAWYVQPVQISWRVHTQNPAQF